MIPARASSLLLTAIVPLAVAACDTLRKPIRGFDKPPPGSIVLDEINDANGGTLVVRAMFDLPQTPQTIRPRLNDQDVVYLTSNEGFYDYAQWQMQGWTGGWSTWFRSIKLGTYVLELVDSAGQSWGRSAPIAVAAVGDPFNPSGQLPAVVFAHFDGKVASWNIDPATEDADTSTDEITVTNLVDQDVVVERCLISSGQSSACTSVGSVAAGADLLTVETITSVSSTDDHQALVVHLASDASQSYRRDLLSGSGSPDFGSTCQIERIFVHGTRPRSYYSPTPSSTTFAMSSCYGYGSGPATGGP